jgi:hypothetical protein
MKTRFNFLRFFTISILGTLAIVIIFNIKSIDQLAVKDFIPVFTVFMVFGVKDFRKYLNYKESINKGIVIISNCSLWGIDNLIISCNSEKHDQIIVRNDLLWIEKHENEDTNNLLKSLISDFEIIAMNRKFKTYLKNKSVEFKLYSSDLKEEKLLKIEVKNYASQQNL